MKNVEAKLRVLYSVMALVNLAFALISFKMGDSVNGQRQLIWTAVFIFLIVLNLKRK